MSRVANNRVFVYVLTIYALWTVWCLLMVKWPSLFGGANLRAVVRVSVVLIPAVIYAFGNGGIWQNDFFLLRKNWKRGGIIGVLTVLAFLIVFFFSAPSVPRFQVPTSFAIWSNWILGSPLAEEMFFRGVALRELTNSAGTKKAVFLSATLFAVLHLPWWIISGEKTGAALVIGFFTMMTYGVVFAVLVTTTKSLWASLIPHWCNNFVAMATSA